MKTKLFFAAIAASLFLSLNICIADVKKFDQKPWLADFTQLELIISETYPNLDTQVGLQGLSPRRMDGETRGRLRNAKSEDEAVQILKDFVERFRDGHFHLEDKNHQHAIPSESIRSIAKTTEAIKACEQMMGSWSSRKKLEFDFPTSKPDGFNAVRVQGAAFPWTTLNMENRKLALIRIVSFGQGDYPELCVEEWKKYVELLPASCDKKCQEIFVDHRLPNRLLHELDETLEQILSENVSAIVLDLTNNGGGTGWVSAAMRMLTNRPILCGGFGFIRHPHWIRKFEVEIAELSLKLKSAKDASEREALEAKKRRASDDFKEARQSCDRSKIWTQEKYSPSCSLVVKRTSRDCSPGEELQFRPGRYHGPVVVLVNRKTASASEDLVGRYKDSGIAMIIGARTRGAGCGFTDGGIDLKLKNSGIRVVIPDCSRFLRDGANEVAGIPPDIELPMNMQSPEFITQLKAALSRALK